MNVVILRLDFLSFKKYMNLIAQYATDIFFYT